MLQQSLDQRKSPSKKRENDIEQNGAGGTRSIEQDRICINEQEGNRVTLELTVRNHPGVMTHVCGLFSRRAYNVEGIFCLPIGDGRKSRILLLVDQDQRLSQMIKQVAKLEDVLDTTLHKEIHPVFEHVTVL